jgi:hypothetical protein
MSYMLRKFVWILGQDHLILVYGVMKCVKTCSRWLKLYEHSNIIIFNRPLHRRLTQGDEHRGHGREFLGRFKYRKQRDRALWRFHFEINEIRRFNVNHQRCRRRAVLSESVRFV